MLQNSNIFLYCTLPYMNIKLFYFSLTKKKYFQKEFDFLTNSFILKLFQAQNGNFVGCQYKRFLIDLNSI